MFKVGTIRSYTDLTLGNLFNPLVLEQGTSYAFLGRTLTLVNKVVRKARIELAKMYLVWSTVVKLLGWKPAFLDLGR
ncbi:hypothetical protein NIES4106_06280 [Fischerella sp. NIES-4106]|nr:hypothetical protein NIES4106_06280 [Fischerella sp. NIES-4106]